MITVVKLGGSYITDKRKPEKILEDRLESIAKELREIEGEKIVIHGGGSFGHYYAKQYGISSAEGFSKTRLAMIRLSKSIAEKLDEYGLSPVIFPGGSHFIVRLVENRRVPFIVNYTLIEEALRLGCTPITYGDVTYEFSTKERRPTIISGDEIAYAIARYTPLRYDMRVIFVSDVEAIYRRRGGPKIKEIYSDGSFVDEEGSLGSIKDIEFRSVDDATGGMESKFYRALSIASLGVPVYVSNSIKKALRGEGTIIK